MELVKSGIIDLAGKTAQDLGLGRIPGLVMGYLYLSEGERSLDEIGEELGLSKAAVSIAARRLENLELLRRVWRKGDRRSYYRVADNFRLALQRGIIATVEAKVRMIGEQLDNAEELIRSVKSGARDAELGFVHGRLRRARRMRDRVVRILESPVVRLLGR